MVLYPITLPPDKAADAVTITASLYYLATPPYYLMQRLQAAKKQTDDSCSCRSSAVQFRPEYGDTADVLLLDREQRAFA